MQLFCKITVVENQKSEKYNDSIRFTLKHTFFFWAPLMLQKVHRNTPDLQNFSFTTTKTFSDAWRTQDYNVTQ